MYICIAAWHDLTDDHLYNTGDAFPHDGRKIPEARIRELSSAQNKAGYALIQHVEDKSEQIPEKQPEAPTRRKKAAKKTV